MKQGISIKVLNIDEDDTVRYRLVLSNDITSTSIEFYDYEDCFQKFAGGLLEFPRSVDDVVEFQIGHTHSQWAYFISIKVFCYERDGRSVLQVQLDNKMGIPEGNKCEFYIPVIPASLNNLGETLSKWNPRAQKEINWIAQSN